MFDYWEQQKDKPLFPDLLWSRPENKALLPKVSIVGGSKHGFVKAAAVYQNVLETGSSSLKLLLPDALKDSLPANSDFIFIESTKTGSFSSSLFDNLRAIQASSDIVIVSEDSGKESELTQALHKIISEDNCDLMMVGESALANDSYFDDIINRQKNTVFVIEPRQLQKITSRLPVQVSFRSSDGLVDLVKGLHQITSVLGAVIFVVSTNKEVIISVNGDVFSTKYVATLEEIAGICSSYHSDDIAKNYLVALSKELQ